MTGQTGGFFVAVSATDRSTFLGLRVDPAGVQYQVYKRVNGTLAAIGSNLGGADPANKAWIELTNNGANYAVKVMYGNGTTATLASGTRPADVPLTNSVMAVFRISAGKAFDDFDMAAL